jgi:hypothetical protein
MNKNVLIASLLSLLATMPALAGEITGAVYYRDGSPCSSCRVSASIRMGAITKTVHTDNKGKFHLTWRGNNCIAELFVEGKTRRRDVPTGEHVVVRLD